MLVAFLSAFGSFFCCLFPRTPKTEKQMPKSLKQTNKKKSGVFLARTAFAGYATFILWGHSPQNKSRLGLVSGLFSNVLLAAKCHLKKDQLSARLGSALWYDLRAAGSLVGSSSRQAMWGVSPLPPPKTLCCTFEPSLFLGAPSLLEIQHADKRQENACGRKPW